MTLEEKLTALTRTALRLFEVEDDDEGGNVHVELVFHSGDVHHPVEAERNPMWSCRIRYGWYDDLGGKEPEFLADACNGAGATPDDAVDSCFKMAVVAIQHRHVEDERFLTATTPSSPGPGPS